jgi:hypothetical protein
MDTFLAVLLALGIYVVIPILIGLLICTAAILYDRRHHKVDKTKAIEESETMVEETPAEKVNETTKVG